MSGKQSICVIATLLATSFAWRGGVARADVFELANGGRIEGRLVEGVGGKENYVIETAGGRVKIARSQVAKIESTMDAEHEYAARSRSVADTVEAHWELAQWCREHKLRSESQKHLARILELDPHHAEARALLGFRKQDGEWMTRDELMASRGLVQYEGRWVTRQHVELMERQKETRLSQAEWRQQLDRWRRALIGRREDRMADALAEVRALDDPQAAEPLVRLLRREEDPALKRLWIEAAARIDHPACVEALVDLSIYDDDDELRLECLEYLVRADRVVFLQPYFRALRSKENEIVNRAGEALGLLGDPEAIGPLIGALVTKHRFQIGGGNPGQQGYTFTPDGGGAFGFGGGGPRFETRELKNPAILTALVRLAGTSFDYDQAAWRAWLAAQAKARPIDVRRDE